LRPADIYPDLIKGLGFQQDGEMDHQTMAPSVMGARARMAPPGAPALLVGFAAEAKVARRSGWHVAIGGGTTEGAAVAAWDLIDAGATGIVSFGLAGGLDPALPPGTLIVAEAVAADGQVWRTDPGLNARLGGHTGQLCLGLEHIVVSTEEKRQLRRRTGASAVDMESGAVAAVAAAAGVPFAVLRAVCDPADRALPPAALVALDTAGRVGAARVVMSVLTNPSQVGALMRLARDAAVARRALLTRAMRLAPKGSRPVEGRSLGILDDELVSDGIL
jgi:adenosylhomocysteine nucleosidase